MNRPSDQALALGWHLIDGYDRFVTLGKNRSRANLLRAAVAGVGLSWSLYFYYKMEGKRKLRRINKQVDKFVHR